MIDGLKIQMTTGELAALLTERIEWHARTAGEYQVELRLPESAREEPLVPEHIIEHEIREHREQAAVLRMLRDHLIEGELYRLGEMDLRFADLVPDFQMDYLRRPPASGSAV